MRYFSVAAWGPNSYLLWSALLALVLNHFSGSLGPNNFPQTVANHFSKNQVVLLMTSSPIQENMYVTPKNFGVATDGLRQLPAYFVQLFGESNRLRGVKPKHFKSKKRNIIIENKKCIIYLLFFRPFPLFRRSKTHMEPTITSLAKMGSIWLPGRRGSGNK